MNMMEQRKLDFNRPVLSVRRIGPTAATPPEVESNKATTDTSHNKFLAIPFYKADLKSGPIRNAGTVPFKWERTPGQPIDERRSVDWKSELPPVAPRLPPGRRRDENEKQQTAVRGSDNTTTDVTRPQSQGAVTTDDKVEKSSEKSHLDAEGSSSEDDDDAYVDARDTLSKSESYYDNCSLSGLSGMEGSDATLTVSVSTDPQTRDFMMGRFLPAAKAMASEAPPHASKMYMARQQQKQATVAVKPARRIATSDYKPNLLRFYIQNDIEEDVEEDTDDEDDQRNISSKGCGLLPRLCLLTPVPGLRVLPRSRGTSVRRMPPNSSSALHSTKCVIEQASFAGHSKVSEIHKERSSPSAESLSVSGASADAKIAKNFASGPKSFKTFQDFLMDQNAEDETQPESPVVEKTVYIDSVHSTETASSRTVNKANTMMITENFDQFPETNEITTDVPCSDFSLQEVKHLSLTDESRDFNAEFPCHCESLQKVAVVSRQDDKLLTDNYLEEEYTSVVKNIATSAEVEIVKDNYPGNQELQLTESSPILTGAFYQLPKPPPLPNSPSDSWLGRTLPKKNQLSRSYLGTYLQIHSKQQTTKQASVDPKWETIVKTSKQQRGHLRYSEEMLTPIPEV